MATSTALRPSAMASRSLTQAMRQHPLFSYFFLAYAFSWIMLIPFVLSEWGVLHQDLRIAFVLNPFVGPALAAYIMIRITEGKAGVLRLRHRIVQWRVSLPWYAQILLGVPALVLLGILVLPGALTSFDGLPPAFLISYALGFVVIAFLGGPLGEEIGWRGFALPRMQPRYGPLGGTLLLGALWVFWHLPHFLTLAQRGGPGTPFVTFLTNFSLFFVMVMAMAIVFTWVFNYTGGSVFMAILLHARINSLGPLVSLFPAPIVADTDVAVLIGFGLLALLVLILTRGRLGYPPNQAQAPTPERIALMA